LLLLVILALSALVAACTDSPVAPTSSPAGPRMNGLNGYSCVTMKVPDQVTWDTSQLPGWITVDNTSWDGTWSSITLCYETQMPYTEADYCFQFGCDDPNGGWNAPSMCLGPCTYGYTDENGNGGQTYYGGPALDGEGYCPNSHPLCLLKMEAIDNARLDSALAKVDQSRAVCKQAFDHFKSLWQQGKVYRGNPA